MSYRPLSDPNEILDVEVETPEMVENARLIECGERQLRMLRRMGDVGMGLVERLEQIAMAGAEASSGEKAAPASIDDIAGAYGKLTQSLRRTLAMEARLAEEMKARRLGVFATLNADRDERIKVVQDGIDETIEYVLGKAIRRERPDADKEAVEGLLVDMFERLNDADEFEDYHQRPPGETVAKLCAAFGLDPEFCIQADDETWMIRQGPAAETRGECRGRHHPPNPGGDPPTSGTSSTAPCPDGVAVSSSP
jgi:hypothetical protein